MKGIPRIVLALALLLAAAPAGGQIVNSLKVDDAVFQRYAYGRMQIYNPSNLLLADSLYRAGVARDNFRYKCLSLALEFPIRYSQGDYTRMDEAVSEIKEMLRTRSDCRNFYFQLIHDYCH